MDRESAFIAALRPFAIHAAARGLTDDAAVLPFGGEHLVITHDMLVEGVHFLADDTPADVAWKLVAVNMSDLAAKGAEPVGVMLGYGMASGGAAGDGDERTRQQDHADWDRAFAAGIADACRHFAVALLGGDTVALPPGTPRGFGLTALGRGHAGGTPSRAGAMPGDQVWVSGTIGDAGLGLSLRRGDALTDIGQDATASDRAALVAAYTRPQPNVALGRALAARVSAIADVSDGLLIDAARIAAASGCGIALALDAVPLSDAYRNMRGDTLSSRIAAATSGDDYVLLFAAPPADSADIAGIADATGTALSCIGHCVAEEGLPLTYRGTLVPTPARLGWSHG